MEEKQFRFWMPIDTLQKGGDKTDKMIVGGLASTATKDMDGESLDPNGFDISYFKNKGIVNWNHNKTPDAVIGEPTKAIITKDGLYVEAELYPDSDLAKSVFGLAKTLEKSSKSRRLGFSIEGKAIKRDEKNQSKVSKALITNVALTISPKNPDSIVNIVKGNFNELSEDELVPYTTSVNSFDAEFEVEKLNKLEKALNTDTDNKTIHESVEGGTKKSSKKKDDEESDDSIVVTVDDNTDSKESKKLTKAEVINRLMKNNSVINFEKANKIYETLNSLEKMAKEDTNISEELLEKALNILGVNEESLQKGVDAEDEEEMFDDKTSKKPAKKSPKSTKDDEKDEEEDDDEDTEKGNFDELNMAKISDMFKGVGTLLKAVYENQNEQTDLIKSLSEENETMKKALIELSEQPNVRKSSARPLQKSFEKGFGDEQPLTPENIMSISQNKNKVLSLLDNMTFEKGFDDELAKAMTTFESSGVIEDGIAQRIKNEKGIILVK